MSDAHSAPLLSVNGVTRRFGSRAVLDELDLTVARGERVALTGPNGSGKTTLLRCVAGCLLPDTGTIAIDGRRAGTRRAKQLIGLSLADAQSFYARLSGRDNLQIFAGLRGLRRRAVNRTVEAIAEELQISGFIGGPVSRYSTGMTQQLANARALLGEPPLLLLDEPTRSLDPQAFARLWSALERRPEASVLIATHRSDDLDRCSRRFALDD